MPQPVSEHRRHVFISYSRADRVWVDRLRTTMAPLLREAGEDLVLWDDSEIRPGELWQKAIETALAQARVALLLVSAEFLASDFVMGREVPVLLEAAEREGVPILWVSLSPCCVSRTSIHQYQAVLPPEPSIAEMTEPEQRRALVRIAEEVHRALVEATARERARLEEKADHAAEQQEEAVEEMRLLSRRNLLFSAAGVPLVAFGLTRLAIGAGGGSGTSTAASPAPVASSSRDSSRLAAEAPPASQGRIQTLQTTHGWLERQGQGWRIQTRPIEVRALLESFALDVELRLIQIPAGRFRMGSPPEEEGRSPDEGPQHEVELASFFMGQTPITQAEWRVVAGLPKVERELARDPSRFKGDDRPVESVSWHDAMEFCRRLSQRLGRTFTLPSEAQWEYACRSGTTTPFSSGDTTSPELANYDGTFSYADGPRGKNRCQTTPVGMFPANAWGLQDMHGNVWEWCLDHWHDSYAGAPSDGRTWSSNAGEDAPRLLRGGSWILIPGDCRSASRFRNRPGYRFDYCGFRVCCLPQDSASLHLNL